MLMTVVPAGFPQTLNSQPSQAVGLSATQLEAQSLNTDDGPRTKKASGKHKSRAPAPLFRSEDIHPDVAVKETAVKEIILPGVMHLEGESLNALDPSRAKHIQMNNGGSQSVYVSSTEINRIQLPFNNPKVVTSGDLAVDKSESSNNVYPRFSNRNRCLIVTDQFHPLQSCHF